MPSVCAPSMEYTKLNNQLLDACKTQDLDMVKHLLSIGANAAYEKISGRHADMSLVVPRKGAMTHQTAATRAGYYDPHKSERGSECTRIRGKVQPLFPRLGCNAQCSHVSPLHEVLMRPPHELNVALVETLLKAGATLNAICKKSTWRSCNSSTAFQMGLSVVVNTNNVDLLRLFLRYGADPNVLMCSNFTELRSISRTTWKPIHMAVERLQLECARVLLDAGAEVDAVRAEKKNNFRRSIEQDAEEMPLHIACRACACAGDEQWDAASRTALSNGEQDDATSAYALVQLLLERGANVNAIRRILIGQSLPVRETVLHIAVKAKLPNLTWLLISAGADVSIPYQIGDDTHTVWELCTGDSAMRYALLHAWTPRTHHRHSRHVRAAIYTLLLVKQRLQWTFPTLVMHTIFEFVASGPWHSDVLYI